MARDARGEEPLKAAEYERKCSVLPLHPYCKRCGWHKGGMDSWNGRACKCGFSELPYQS